MRIVRFMLFPLLLLACSNSDGSKDKKAQVPASDTVGATMEITAPEVSGETPETTLAPGDDMVSETPTFPEVTFIKRPYLQWPTKTSVTLQAETANATPLAIVLTHDDGSFTTITEPYQPEFSFLGVPMDGLTGWFHKVDLPIPEGVEQFDLEIANAPDYHRHVVLPQYLDSFSMIAFGDTRTNLDIHQTVSNQIVAENPLIVFQTGDLMDSGLEVAQWNTFFDIESKMLEESFYFPIFGNHELGGESYYYEFFETRNTFHSERNWYADWGPVGFIGIEQYTTHWELNDEALNWLEEALAKLQDKRWLIFSHHEPMYTFSSHGPWYEGREVVQPLLEQYGVDLVLSGHNHCYERFLVNDIPYIVTGGGGAPLYSTGSGPEEELPLAQNWGKFHHFVRLDISPEKIHVTVVDTEEQSIFEEFDLE